MGCHIYRPNWRIRHAVMGHNPAIPSRGTVTVPRAASALFPFRSQRLMLRPIGSSWGGPMTTLKTLAGACVFALLAILPAQAQTAPPPYGPPIGIENARKVMNAAEGEAAKNNW